MSTPEECAADMVRLLRETHRSHHNAAHAHHLLEQAMARTLEDRIDEAVVTAIELIEAEARRERNETVIDFVRVDVRDGVWFELLNRGFGVKEAMFRACAGTDGNDAVASIVVRW
jgi:hypothetical protein